MPTQADQLPINFTKELRIIDPLQGRSDYNLWAAMTKKVLEQHDLEDLVDSTVDRPPTGHEKYEAWKSQSKSVSMWLVTIISKEIFSGLFSGHWKWKYADETFDAIKTIVMGHGHNTANIIVTQALDTRRSQFGTVEHAAALRERLQNESSRSEQSDECDYHPTMDGMFDVTEGTRTGISSMGEDKPTRPTFARQSQKHGGIGISEAVCRGNRRRKSTN